MVRLKRDTTDNGGRNRDPRSANNIGSSATYGRFWRVRAMDGLSWHTATLIGSGEHYEFGIRPNQRRPKGGLNYTEMQVRDITIVGAGPAGLAAGIAAKRAGLSYSIIEKGVLVNSIYRFPVNMVFVTTPELL